MIPGFPVPTRERVAVLQEQTAALRIQFLNTQLQTALTLAVVAETHREMRFAEAANRCYEKASTIYEAMRTWMSINAPGGAGADQVRERAELLERALRGMADTPEVDLRPPEPLVDAALTAPVPDPHITPRELDVARLIADGLSTKQIAHRLSISFKTAACHRVNLMTKLKAPNAPSLVAICLRRGLL